MKLKKSLFLLSPVLILFASTALFSSLIIDDPQDKSIASESSSAIEFIDEMDDISSSPNVDYDGEVVDYYSTNNQYELQTDVDFAGVENLYDGTMNVSLIDGSSFNGNGYSIKNRWDSTQFETYFNSESNSRGIEWMNDFDETYSNVSIPIYLFDPFQDVDVYNLTFDNSPFAFAGAASSSFVNVNMTNIDIENVGLDFNWTGNSIKQSDINSFNMPLFMYQADMDFVWENSYVNNVTIANNTFDFSDVALDPGASLGFPYNVDVKIGLVGKAMKASTTSSMIFRNLEFTNWNISNNQIMVNTYTQDNFINDPNLKITPFVMDGGKYGLSTPSTGNYSELSAKNTSSREVFEDDIDISQIYFHNWTINDNTFLDSSNSTSYSSVNFSMGPNIINDDVLNIDFSSIYLDNIQSNQEVIGDEYYYDADTNTIISYSDDYILQSNELIENALGPLFNSSDSNLLDDQAYKESVFDPQFWDTQSEDLTLKTSSYLSFDSNIKYDWSSTPFPYFSFDIQPNNFWVEQLDINLLDQNQNIIYSNSIQNNEDPKLWSGSNDIFELNLSMFPSFNLSSSDTYTLNIDFSQYNENYQYSFTLNANSDFLIYDFEDTYSDGVLSYGFNYIDPYNEITSFDLSLYNKSKLVFEDNISTSSFEQYSFTSYEVSGSQEVKIDNLSNYYFVFDVNTINSQGEQVYHLIPQPQSPDASFVLGDDVYISDFKTSPNTWLYYYWWVILVTILVVLILLIISILVYLYLRAQKTERNVESRIQEYAEEHGIALSTFYEIKEIPQDQPIYYDNYQEYDDTTYDEDNFEDSTLNNYYEPSSELDRYFEEEDQSVYDLDDLYDEYNDLQEEEY